MVARLWMILNSGCRTIWFLGMRFFRSARTTPQIRDSDSAGISSGVIQADFDGGPVRAEREPLGPLDDHDGLFGQGVLEAEGFEIVKVFYAVEIDVIDLARVGFISARRIVNAELVNQIERGAGDVFFLGGAQAADDSLGQRGLAAAEVSLQQHQDGRAELRCDFPALGDGFFRGVRNKFV